MKTLLLGAIAVIMFVIMVNLNVIADNSSKSKTVEKYYDESENVVCYYVDNAMSCIWSMEKFK